MESRISGEPDRTSRFTPTRWRQRRRILGRNGATWLALAVLATAWMSAAWAQEFSTDVYKYPNLAMTPPMGWNTWNTFYCDVDEALIRETADAIVASGMRDAGYDYVNIDGCWQGARDADGNIQPDATRFPSGIKALADYVHSKGLKIGIYSDAGDKTCDGRPGGRGYDYQDAQQYARWGIDYLKYDWCYTQGVDAETAYRTMSIALREAGRPILFSICEWGTNKPWIWAPPIGHMWRTTPDMITCWDCVADHGTYQNFGVMNVLDMQDNLRQYARPGQWNDPDMLQVGNMASTNEDRAHFAMWAMLAAPLIAGNDIRNMSAETRQILTNKEVIAVDQDELGVQGFPLRKEDGVEIWFKPLAGDAWAMAILNRNNEPRDVRFDWAATKVEDSLSNRQAQFDQHTYTLRDLFAHTDAGSTTQALELKVPGRDVVMYRLGRQ